MVEKSKSGTSAVFFTLKILAKYDRNVKLAQEIKERKKQSMEKHQREYQTKNLFIATFLLASQKVNFLGLRTIDRKTKLFRFSPKKEAEKLETDYFRGAPLPVKTIFAEYNTLKDMLFQRETNGEKYGRKTVDKF